MVEKLDAKSYSPQSRLRYYMVGWFSPSVEAIAIKETISDDRRDAMLSQSWLPRAFDLMHHLSGHPMQIESFLLPDDHDEVTDWRAHRLSTKIDKDAKAKGGSSGSDCSPGTLRGGGLVREGDNLTLSLCLEDGKLCDR